MNLKGWSQSVEQRVGPTSSFFFSALASSFISCVFTSSALQIDWIQYWGQSMTTSRSSPNVLCNHLLSRWFHLQSQQDNSSTLWSLETYFHFLRQWNPSYLFIYSKSPGPPANTHALQNLEKSSETLQHLWVHSWKTSELTKLSFRPRFKLNCVDYSIYAAVLVERAI